MNVLLAQSEGPDLGGGGGDLEINLDDAPADPEEAVNVVLEQIGDLWTAVLESLPIVAIGLVVLIIAVLMALGLARAFKRGIRGAGLGSAVAGLLFRIVRVVLLLCAVLFALSVMGVEVGAVLGTLAVLGFAIGLAVQGILENFVAGIILLIRKPFTVGDQVVSGDFEGTVQDIDFRVTKLLGYDGTANLIPNADVYNNPITNLTAGGKRRTTLTIGVDYRDDQDQARQILEEALATVDGVMAAPAPEALLTELGESSVNFELRYWTKPDIASVRRVQDRVLSAAKRAVEEAGMSIPWPIRTLVVDGDSDIQVSQRRSSA